MKVKKLIAICVCALSVLLTFGVGCAKRANSDDINFKEYFDNLGNYNVTDSQYNDESCLIVSMPHQINYNGIIYEADVDDKYFSGEKNTGELLAYCINQCDYDYYYNLEPSVDYIVIDGGLLSTFKNNHVPVYAVEGYPFEQYICVNPFTKVIYVNPAYQANQQ